MESQTSSTPIIIRRELSTGSIMELGLGVALGLSIIVTYIIHKHAKLHDIFFGRD